MAELDPPRYQKGDRVASIGEFQKQGQVTTVRYNHINESYSYLVKEENEKVHLFFEPQLVLVEAGNREGANSTIIPTTKYNFSPSNLSIKVSDEEISWFRRYYNTEQAELAFQLLEASEGDLATATQTAAEQAGIQIGSPTEWLLQQSKAIVDVILGFIDSEKVRDIALTEEDVKDGIPDFIGLITGLIVFKLTAITPQLLIVQFFLLIHIKKVLRNFGKPSEEIDIEEEKDEID